MSHRWTGHIDPNPPRYDRPFYWTRVNDPRSAPSGWYQWTERGLVYLGGSILESMAAQPGEKR